MPDRFRDEDGIDVPLNRLTLVLGLLLWVLIVIGLREVGTWLWELPL